MEESRESLTCHHASPAKCGASSLAAGLLLLQHGIDHLHHEALLRLGQAGDVFKLQGKGARWKKGIRFIYPAASAIRTAYGC